MITEEECARRIRSALLEHEQEIERLRGKLKQEKFHRAIAEWAVAGVISRGLRVNAQVDTRQQQVSMADVCHLVGSSAGHQFLRAAEREFRYHAEYHALLRESRPYQRYDHDGAVPAMKDWPRPFE